MQITVEQKELLNIIMNNKENLEALFKLANQKKINVKDLKIGDTVEFAGLHWSKFAEDENGNAYMLADECYDIMKFGSSNDWRKSPIRQKLNDELREKIVEDLGEEVLVLIETDLFSHDGLRDYGVCEDKVSILTYDLYRNNRGNIKTINRGFWLATPNSTPSGYSSGCVQFVDSGGRVTYGDYYCGKAVRPFCILRS